MSHFVGFSDLFELISPRFALSHALAESLFYKLHISASRAKFRHQSISSDKPVEDSAI